MMNNKHECFDEPTNQPPQPPSNVYTMEIDTGYTMSHHSFNDTISVSSAQGSTKDGVSFACDKVDIQQKYRAKLVKFFAHKPNYERLEKIVYHRNTNIFSMLLFFVIRYKTETIYPCQRTYDTGPETNSDGKPIYFFYRPKEEYSRALKKYKKKFYNFEDRAGTGVIAWNNIVNPKFHVSPENGPISLPLAKLNAVYWVIQYGFDAVFWENYDAIVHAYETFTTKTKRRYTEAHKKKKQKIRAEAEEQVIAERDRKLREQQEYEANDKTNKKRRHRTLNTNNRGKRKTRLNRELRKQVTELIQDRKRKLKEQAKKSNELHKRRRQPQKHIKIATTMMVDPPSIVF